MKAHRIAAIGSITLGVAISAAAILGPLAFKTIKFRTSENIETQFMGGEIVSLGLVAPALVGASIMWLRGHRLAPAVAIGPSLYAVYTYVTVIGGQEYGRYPGNVEKFFPLYAALVGGGAVLAGYSWRHLADASIPPPSSGLRRSLATIFLGVSSFVAIAWTAQIRNVLTGSPPADYLEAPTLFWLIKSLDFGFCLPALAFAGIGLLRRNPLAECAACALAGFSTCLVGSITGMAVAMEIRNDPGTNSVMLVALAGVTAGLGYTTWRYLTLTEHHVSSKTGTRGLGAVGHEIAA